MGRLTGHLVLIAVFLFSSPWCAGQPDESPADKYFAMLREQPGNSYLYDRFYQACLDTKTAEQLETFLKANLDERDDLGSRLLLALFYERQGQDTKALQLYKAVSAGSPVTSEFLFYRARIEARNLDLDAAISDLVKARELPCSGEIAEKASRLLGELYIRTDQKDKAATLWRQLLQPGDEHQELCVDLIELQIKEGLFDDALQMNNELISMTKDPYKSVMRRLRQGDIYQYKGDTDKALDVYAKAMESVGEGSWLENQIYAQIEQLFNRDDNTQGLKDYLTGLVRRYPKRIGLKKQLANLLLQTGATNEAVRVFQEILRVTPGDTANQQAYVKILADAGQLDKAIQLLEQLCKDNRQDGELLISLAELYHKNHQDEQAGAVLDRFLGVSDRGEYACLRVTGLLEQYGLRERAEGVYKQTLTALPANLSVRQAYAEFLYRMEREDEAQRMLRVVAQKGDLQMLMRACNAAGAHEHGDLALQWAEARYNEFAKDVTYLNHLCKMAIRQGSFDKALGWAMQQLQAARDFSMIRSALSQVMAAVDSDEKAQRMIRDMESKDRLTIQEACLLSELLALQGQAAEADAVMMKAMQRDPEIAARQQVDLCRRRSDWARAAEVLETLLTRTGTREPNLLREIVEAYEKCGRYEDALKWVQEWKHVSPTSAAPHLCHSQLLEMMGRADEAVAAAEAAGRESQGDAEVLSQLAKLYASLGRNDESQRTYWRLYEARQNIPEKLNVVREMAKTAEQAGTQAALIERLQRQRQQDNASALPLLALAEVYNQMGKYEERRQALLEASRLQSEDLSLLYELASVEEAHGDWENAVRTLERALALDKTSKTRLKIAGLHIQHGRQEDGFRVLTEMAGGSQMDPRDAEAIAGTMMSVQAWDSAVRFLQGLLPLHSKDYRLGYQYAVALEEAGRTAEAIESFIDLLDLNEEIPGNTNKQVPFTWSRQGVDTHIERVLPVEAVELLRLDQGRSTAYQYRNERMRRLPAAMRPANLPSNVTLPPTVDDLRYYVISHILTLAASLSDQGKSQVAADLTRHGVANVEILMAVPQMAVPQMVVPPLGLSSIRATIETLARDYPDNKAVQAVRILHQIEGQGYTLQDAQHIFDLFEHTHPRLAMVVGLRCFGPDPKASQLFRQSMQMLKDVSDLGYYEISAVAYVLENSPAGASLTEEQRAFLDQHLIDWYAKLGPTAANRTEILRYIASLLGHQKDLSNYIRFLDREVGGGSNPAVAANPSPNQPVVWHLSYPPRSIPGFPDHVRGLVLDGSNYNFPRASRMPRIEPEKLGSYLDQIKDPVLKILVAMTSGRIEDARKLTKAFLDANPTSLAAYVLAASQAAVDSAPLEVIALLEKARSLPAPTPCRQMLDGALIAAAVELDPQKYPGQIALGKRAVLRLMGDRLDPSQREELLAAAETLGLTEEAENIRNQISASATVQFALSPSPAVSDVRPFTIALMEQLFEKRQTDAALRLVLNHLKNEAHDSLYCRVAGSTPSVVQDMVKLIDKHGMTAQLMALAGGLGKATPRKLVEYGRICELLGRPQEAVAAYEKALASDPKNTAVRMRLALLSMTTDPKSGAKYLATIDPGAVNQVGQRLVNLARQSFFTGQMESALGMARMITEYLALLKDSEKQNLDWVDGLADAIAAECRNGPRQLRRLYEAPGSSTTIPGGGRGSQTVPFAMMMQLGLGSPVREDAPTATQRRGVHDALCRKMLEIPQLAEVGFARLAAEAKARGALTNQYTGMARQAMLTYKPSRQPNALPAAFMSLQPMDFVTPAEYLVREAHKAGNVDRLINEFVPQLKQKGADDQATRLVHLADIYTAKADQFFAAVDRLLSGGTAQGPAPGRAVADESRLVPMVIEAYLARDATQQLSMEQFILDKIKEDIDQGHFVHQYLAEGWLSILIGRDKASARAFVDSIVTLYSSPQGKVSGLDGVFRQYAFRLDNPFTDGSRTQVRRATVQPPRSARGPNQGAPTRRGTTTRGRTRPR